MRGERTPSRRSTVILVAVCAAVALAHTLALAPHYHFGSFDDDAGYVEVAHALRAGHGLTSLLPVGLPLAATYPPGFAGLLALLTLFGGGVTAYRVVTTALFLAVFPLFAVYLRRREVATPVFVVTFVLLALNPVASTFATMV